MRRLVFALSALLLASCAGSPLRDQCVGGTIQMTVHLIETEHELRALYARALVGSGEKPHPNPRAFMGVDREGHYHLFLLTLRGQDDPRLLDWGHELAHIVCGRWHDEVPRGKESVS